MRLCDARRDGVPDFDCLEQRGDETAVAGWARGEGGEGSSFRVTLRNGLTN